MDARRREAERRAGAFVLLVLLVAVAACGTQPPPSVSPPDRDAAWQLVGPALGDCAVRAAVVRASGELMAVCQGGDLRALLLSTRDGTEWEIGDAEGVVGRRPDQAPLVNALIENSHGFLVLAGADAARDLSAGDAAMWTSERARSWTRGPRSRSVEDGEMFDVVDTEDARIAVGADGFPGASVQMPGLRGPVVWRSEGLVRWERIPLPAEERLLAVGIARVSGGFVAWGQGAPPGTGAAWISTDGLAWEAVVAPFGEGGGPIGRVVESPDGELVAVGCVWREGGEPLPGLWHSGDGGRTWAAADVAGGEPATGCLRDAIWTGDRFVATGAHARVMWSIDGISWVGEPVDSAMSAITMDVLLAYRGSLVGAGSFETANGSSAALWRRGIPQ